MGGPLPGEQQTVPRAELQAALQAVVRAVAPILLLIDNEEVCQGVARVGGDPEGYDVELRSELADLWRELRQVLLHKPPGFCSSIWAPS